MITLNPVKPRHIAREGVVGTAIDTLQKDVKADESQQAQDTQADRARTEELAARTYEQLTGLKNKGVGWGKDKGAMQKQLEALDAAIKALTAKAAGGQPLTEEEQDALNQMLKTRGKIAKKLDHKAGQTSGKARGKMNKLATKARGLAADIKAEKAKKHPNKQKLESMVKKYTKTVAEFHSLVSDRLADVGQQLAALVAKQPQTDADKASIAKLQEEMSSLNSKLDEFGGLNASLPKGATAHKPRTRSGAAENKKGKTGETGVSDNVPWQANIDIDGNVPGIADVVDGMDADIERLLNDPAKLSAKGMLKLQQLIARRSELMSLASNLISAAHDTRKSVAGNVRA